jgi:hypothetical protein
MSEVCIRISIESESTAFVDGEYKQEIARMLQNVIDTIQNTKKGSLMLIDKYGNYAGVATIAITDDMEEEYYNN